MPRLGETRSIWSTPYTFEPSFSIRLLRQEFLSGPPERQRETIARVRRTLAAQRAQRVTPPSYLMKHAAEIYGIAAVI